MHIKKEDFLKLPNVLTYIRILLVPVFIYIFLRAENPASYLTAGVVVLISALTDILDGIIARKFKIITDWGKIIDPIADKLMQAAMLFCVVYKAREDRIVFLSLVIITSLFVIKELVTFFVSAFLYRKGKHLDGSIWCGKACTVVIYFVMLLLIIFPKLPDVVRLILLMVAGIFLIIAFVVYMYEYKKMYSDTKKN